MSRWCPWTCFLILVLGLFPKQVLAQAPRVVILPITFESDIATATTESKSALTQAVMDGAVDAGLEICDKDCAIDAANRAKAELSCRERACLSQIVKAANANEAIAVSVLEHGELDYEVKLAFARADDIDKRAQDGFFVVAAELRRLTALALSNKVETPEAPATTKERRSVEPERNKPLSKQVFWSLLASTALATLAFGATEVTGLALYGDANSSAELDTLQIIDRVFLVTTAALAVTTTVVGCFTDFGNEREKKRLMPAMAPTSSASGAILVLQGSF